MNPFPLEPYRSARLLYRALEEPPERRCNLPNSLRRLLNRVNGLAHPTTAAQHQGWKEIRAKTKKYDVLVSRDMYHPR